MQKEKKEYLSHILKNLPKKPGVYQMKDKDGSVIYIGKAKSLKNRVASYFQNSKDHDTKTQKMVEQIMDIDCTVVSSNLEAIMLETNLIKTLRPKYNILMKDDKNYVYVKITVNEDFPRIIITRKVEKDGARYFGPKTAKHKVQKTLKVLKRIFPYRHCGLAIDYEIPSAKSSDPKRKHKVKVTKASIKYPCIDYHIKRCIGPCVGTVDKEEYRAVIDQVINFLEGKHEEVLERLKDDMAKAAAEKKFEVAAALRDKLQAVQDIMEAQHITTPDLKDQDIINYIVRDDQAFFNLFQVRNGKLINQENFVLQSKTADFQEKSHILDAFIEQYYEKATDLPEEILIPHDLSDNETIEEWLTTMKKRKVKVLVPKLGHKSKVLQLSLENAQNFAKLNTTKWEGHEKAGRDEALAELQTILNLPSLPKRIECYDISHLGGKQTVGSMVVFSNGFPFKNDYRKFKLHQNTAGEPDDYASMEETLTRRLRYLSPAMVGKDLKILKARKKDLAAIFKDAKKTPKDLSIFVIEKDKKRIGWLQVLTTKTKKVFIKKIHIDNGLSDDILRFILKQISKKIKSKRVYLNISDEKIGPFEAAGCQQIAKLPENIKPADRHKVLVFDSTKYQEDSSFRKKPDLLVIDGGKGQLSTVVKVLKKYDLNIPVISLAKKNEEIFIPEKQTPIILSKFNQTLHLVQHIRDEAHRFAISFQQNLSLKSGKSSILDTIPGIGDRTKMKLLNHFGSPENVKNATMYELEKVVGKKSAINIKEKLNAI